MLKMRIVVLRCTFDKSTVVHLILGYCRYNSRNIAEFFKSKFLDGEVSDKEKEDKKKEDDRDKEKDKGRSSRKDDDSRRSKVITFRL